MPSSFVLFRTLRQRLIAFFTLFGVGLSLFFGFLVWGLLEWFQDDIFNLQVAAEVQHQQQTFMRTRQFDLDLPRDMVLLTESQLKQRPDADAYLEMPPSIDEPNEDIDNIHVGIFLHPVTQERLYILFDVSTAEPENSGFLTVFFSILLLSVAIVSVAATFSGSLISIYIVRPLEKLTAYTRELTLGRDFDSRKSFGSDEVGLLAQTIAENINRNNRFLEREQRFTREVSHELRTPVAVIQNALELLRLKPDAPQPMERAERATREIGELIETFLLLGREENLQLQNEQIAADQVIHSVIEKQRQLAQVPIHCTIKGDPALKVLAPVFAVLVRNLLANACQHTNHGKIEVTLTNQALIVADSGCGMNEETVAKIGQPYLPDASGSGLGLSIVKRICTQFGWRLQVQSELGVGTEMGVRFITV